MKVVCEGLEEWLVGGYFHLRCWSPVKEDEAVGAGTNRMLKVHKDTFQLSMTQLHVITIGQPDKKMRILDKKTGEEVTVTSSTPWNSHFHEKM